MNTALRWALAAAILSTTAACTEAVDADTESSQASIVGAPSALRGTEMLVHWESRAELATALARTPNGAFDFGDVIVPGVLFVQHQYSIAALHLEVPSWSMLTGLPTDNPGAGSWGIDQSHGVAFPRRLGRSEANFVASEQAAATLFNAMTGATATTEQVAPNVVVTTRASANKTFRCSKTVATGTHARTEFDCVIAGVSEVGGTGLIWRH